MPLVTRTQGGVFQFDVAEVVAGLGLPAQAHIDSANFDGEMLTVVVSVSQPEAAVQLNPSSPLPPPPPLP